MPSRPAEHATVKLLFLSIFVMRKNGKELFLPSSRFLYLSYSFSLHVILDWEYVKLNKESRRPDGLTDTM